MKNLSRRQFLQLLSSIPGIYMASKFPIDRNSTITTTVFDDYSGIGSIFIQDSKAKPLYNPDEFGFYWGMVGTPEYPTYEYIHYGNITLLASIDDSSADFLELEIVASENNLSLLQKLHENKPLVSLYFPSLINDIGEYIIHLYNCKCVNYSGVYNGGVSGIFNCYQQADRGFGYVSVKEA